MWPFSARIVPARGHDSCGRRQDALEDRLDRIEEKLALDRALQLNTLEKVVNKLVGRIRKREREETGKDLEPELAQGDEREHPFTPAPPPLTAHLARRFRSF